MKKLYLIPLFAMLFAVTAYAQKASESNEKFSKGVEGTAVVLTCPGQPNNVEDVLKKRFKDCKGKNGSSKGWKAVEQAVWSEVSPKTLDYFYKVEKAGNDQSKIMVMMSFGNNNFLSSKDDNGAINNMKKILEEMVTEVQRYELQIAIDAQTKVYEKTLKDQEKLVKDGEDLVKEQENLEKKLEDNKKDQEKNKKDQEDMKKEVEKEKKLLDEIQKQLDSVK